MPFIVKSLRRVSDKAPGGGLFDMLIQTRMFFLKWLAKEVEEEKMVNSWRNEEKKGDGVDKHKAK